MFHMLSISPLEPHSFLTRSRFISLVLHLGLSSRHGVKNCSLVPRSSYLYRTVEHVEYMRSVWPFVPDGIHCSTF